jgi:hypothetical protein
MTVVAFKYLQRRFSMSWNLLRHPLFVLTAVALLAAIVALVVAAGQPDSASFTLISNIIVFLASGLMSYLITHSNERQQFSQELAKLAEFSRRRVGILSANLTSLTEEISNIQTLEEIKRLVMYTLLNLGQDARASVKDIEDMVGITLPAPKSEDVTTTPDLVALPEPPASTSAPTPILAPAQDFITYNCTVCGYSNSSPLGSEQGATKHATCTNCHSRLFLHRLADGAYRVVRRDEKRLSTYAISRPLEASTAEATWPRKVHPYFSCPRCQHHISYSDLPDQAVIEKPCFSCLSVVSYDKTRDTARVIREKTPAYIDSIDVDTIECNSCGTIFSPKVFRTVDGRRFICCFNCNQLYFQKQDEKVAIEKKCVTPSCGNTITFKVSEKEPQARQFCFECMNRFSYDRGTDQMKWVEKLKVPKLTFREFAQRGKTCPHCNSPATGRTTRNSRGQRLSICWNCKNVFELVSLSEPVLTIVEELEQAKEG